MSIYARPIRLLIEQCRAKGGVLGLSNISTAVHRHRENSGRHYRSGSWLSETEGMGIRRTCLRPGRGSLLAPFCRRSTKQLDISDHRAALGSGVLSALSKESQLSR